MQKIFKNADVTSLSKDALELYISKTNKEFSFNSKALLNDLLNKDLMEADSKTGDVRPTGNCILLFGKNPRDKFPQAAVKAKVDYGAGIKPDTESFDDAIVLVPEKVEQWVKKVIPESMDRSNFALEKVLHFPPDVIREAIINAIIHRDYSIKGAKIELEITPDKIEVRSPGEPISPNTIKELQNFTAISQTRNPDLAYIFNLMRFMEESGVGMDTYRTLRKKYNLPLPIIKYKSPNVIVTFPRTLEAVKNNLEKQPVSKLSKDELGAFEIFREHISITKVDFASQTGLSNRSAERLLKKFADLKLIRKQGSGPSTNYIINE